MSAESNSDLARTEAAFSKLLRSIAWDQWAQMGVAVAPPARTWDRVADLEALLLFTLEVGRDEPRLFDEALDWVVRNDSLLSVHRLRGLCSGVEDRQLVDSALSWAAGWGSRTRTESAPKQQVREWTPLFRNFEPEDSGMERAFAAHGLSRPMLHPSCRSQPPDLRRSINLALRLRRLFGVGARAEVVRVLLTTQAPRMQAQVVARSAGFSSRNVREALLQLADAGIVDSTFVGEERSYAMNRAGWDLVLGLPAGSWPAHYEWIPALRALTRILRWLNDPQTRQLSDYLRWSQARTLVETVSSDLAYAGVRAGDLTRSDPGTWSDVSDLFVGVATQIYETR